MLMQTKDLTGPALDWAVEVAKGSSVYMRHDFMNQRHSYLQSSADLFWHLANQDNDPIIGDVFTGETRFLPKNSTDWSQGGPIIEREQLDVLCSGAVWDASTGDRHPNVIASGPTPLIAAMRCYVASKLGDTVDIPEELL